MHIRNKHLTRLGLMTALALSAFAADARAEYGTSALGGNGGGPWKSPCRPNDVLVGVHVNYGSAVDAITAICSPLNDARTDWAGGKYLPTQLWGGEGGRGRELTCERGHAVHRLTAGIGPWDAVTVVKGIGLLCGDLDAAYYYEVKFGAQSTVTRSGEVKCQDGDWATGLFGKSGALVDQVGLLCDHIAPGAGGGTQAGTTTAKPVKSMKKAKSPLADTDIYDTPEGEVIGIMRAGKIAAFLESTNGWCKLENIPPDQDSGFAGGTGWIWLGEEAGCR